MISHPYQDMKVRITAGQYADATVKVIRVLPDFGEHGFVEVRFDAQGKKKPVSDLIPACYIGYPDADVAPSKCEFHSQRGGAHDNAEIDLFQPGQSK
ncbi:hypothetical protein [Paraburkholderia bryophila]|uniref:Uncharacterized protein n=1 Tax=Paraburkholderia bryophila TaxID=420952 RepID=A0A7Z0B7B1_9BURK|nr:hypothetical protein [Paraburkholderia bryophila]NYH23959.1 hypothetical protein [Paraburkholderia bryophila]